MRLGRHQINDQTWERPLALPENQPEMFTKASHPGIIGPSPLTCRVEPESVALAPRTVAPDRLQRSACVIHPRYRSAGRCQG
jgi:hypothetical protein